jgi:hypothetical protein
MKRLTWVILCFAIAVHLSFLLSLKLGFWNSFFNDTAPYARGQGGDFFVFYSSAKFLLEGKSIYSFPAHPSVPYSYAPYIYLPHMILIAVPFALLPPAAAYWLWVVFAEGLLCLCIYITYRIARKANHPYPWLGAVPWLAFTPVYLDLYLGHVELMLALAFMLLIWGQVQGKDHWSYWGWNLSVFTKIITLPFAFAFLRLRKTLWVLLTLGLTFIPFIIYLSFYHAGHLPIQYQIRIRSFARAFAGAPNFMVLLNLWGLPDGIIIFLKFFLLGLGLTFTLAKEVEPIDNWALWITSFLLIYGFTWEHHYLMLLPFLAFYLLRPKTRWLWGVYLFLALPTPYIFFKQREIYDGIYYLSKVVPLWAFYFYILKRHWQAPTRWLYFDSFLKKAGG